jgi:hypothetical protein
MPELELNVDLDDVVVDGTDKRKPLDLGISPVQSEIDQSKAREIPIEVHAPSRQKEIDDYTAYQRDKIFNDTFDEGRRGNAPIHNDVDIIDSTLEEEELPAGSREAVEDVVEEAKKAEEQKLSDWQDAYVKSIWSEEDEKEAEKKKKAAQWILAAQMLGDSIGALSNVYWTGKGANAMKFEPGAQKAAAATYQLDQDIRNAREKAAKAQMDAALKKYEMEWKREREKVADERYNAEQAENKRRYEEGVAYRKGRDAIADARNKELMEFRKQQENRIANNSRGESAPKEEPIEFTIRDGETIGINNFNRDKLYRLYKTLPEEVRKSVEEEDVYSASGLQTGTKKRDKVTDDDRLRAIYENLDNPDVANAIRRLAGVENIAPKEGEVKSEVVVDPLTGKSYSVNPENPVIGGTQIRQYVDY